MKERIYVCHTYYHVYVTFLKELALPRENRGQATLVLSKMSNHFENLKNRVESTGLFEQVIEFDEKREDFFPELVKLRSGGPGFLGNLWSRIRFTRLYAKLEEPYIPVNFRDYGDTYVYCDSDPIGYYLNQKKIPYHALEDGLNCLKNFDAARYDNRGHFKLKAFLSRKLNLIFVQNGYGKYCIDMEVNDISAIRYPCPRYIEQSRQALADRLTSEDKALILQAFIRDMDQLQAQIAAGTDMKDKILILTDPLCTLDVRERIFRDIIHMYEKEGTIFLKPHPRDNLDYRTLFAEYPQFDATVPMEMLNFFPGLRFKKVVAVLTEIKAIQFADEVVRLGEDFMDAYEDPLIHRQNQQI
ncbi:glycosyltransferase family 52 [Acetatifactor aquisgranensis]|uniref:glycosyltransferase family 52 n=1 Tax=Acetatifactor aquisgranensis TaxID=2941233 RepID=UPI00203ADB9D|nr:glycosyltransferase family 52 [Acetatifactor aquisgranensis]MCI8542063.1 lipooligosaccharide sialyltransferase [Lachnospiraceae bacterium]